MLISDMFLLEVEIKCCIVGRNLLICSWRTTWLF